METIDKILQIVVETREDVKDLKIRVGNLEDVQHKTFDKLDGFLALINRHESELAALRSAYKRLEERISRLEGHRA